jgi:ribosomal protein S18 acetylase RimI-like enzyme
MDIRLERVVPPVSDADVAFCVKALHEVFSSIDNWHDAGAVKPYLDEELARDDTFIFIAVSNATNERVGLLSVTRFAMPRYLGHAYEVEEMCVLPAFQGKGVATRMLELLVARYEADPKARKLLIRTNDTNHAAKKAYGRVCEMTDMISMHKFLNKLPHDPPGKS